MVVETWEHAYIEANGVRFHYVSQGLNTNRGPLVLLLHGVPGTLVFMAPSARPLG